MNFYPDFFNVGENLEGNLSALGMTEEEMENEVRDMVNDLKLRYGLCVPAYVVTEEMHDRRIPYEHLPQYMRNIIDELDVY